MNSGLSFIVPFLGFLVLLFLPKENMAMIRMAIGDRSCGLCGITRPDRPDAALRAEYQFVTDVPWISYPAINYHIGMDGISLWL